MSEPNDLKDWTKLELFYKLTGPDVSLLFKLVKSGKEEFGTACKLIGSGIVCEDGVVRFNATTLKRQLEIALPRILASIFELTAKREGFDG
ncbi:hypothetical protein LCGC14_1973860 [marine sediment metagenome]|uniref:Uncharacterized protein n=1 Tax=marine sediment metagenome TaxID=412755 RepID=A0A0F9FBB2_9ZZZZ